MVEVFIFAGQSNSGGAGARSALASHPSEDPPNRVYADADVGDCQWIWTYGLPWAATWEQYPATNELYGQDLSFLALWRAANPTTGLAAVKCGAGGTNISQWRNAAPTGTDTHRGEQWPALAGMVEQATADLDAEYGAGNWRWAAMVWMQGESGADDVYKQTIDTGLGDFFIQDTLDFFADVRAITRPDLPVVFGRISDGMLLNLTDYGGYTAEQHYQAISRRRWQQDQIAAQGVNVAMWSNDGITPREATGPDAVHWTDGGYLASGERAYAAYVSLTGRRARVRSVRGLRRLRVG